MRDFKSVCEGLSERRIRTLVSNVAINVVGTALPMVAGVVSIPLLLTGLGRDRLGLFTLALALFGFAGVFDLGIGRALTRTVAHQLGSGRSSVEIAALVIKGLAAVGTLGLGWAFVIFVSKDRLVHALPISDPQLLFEATQSIRTLAFLVPVALLSGSLAGVLEGAHAFRRVNAVRTPLGIATYLVPAAASLSTHELNDAVFALAVVRVGGLVAWLVLVDREFPLRWPRTHVDASPLWRYSGWLTVSNTIGPVMTTADRFYLAALFPPAAIANYTVPFDAFYRVTAFPAAALNVVFPSISRGGADDLPVRSILAIAAKSGLFLWWLPLVMAGLFVKPLLSAWLGPGFAASSVYPAAWIVAGMLINGFALVPFTVLQAEGRVSLTARFHMFEVVPYVLALVILTTAFGITGAAMAWTLRVTVDAALLTGAVARSHPAARAQLRRLSVVTIAGACCILLGTLLGQPLLFAVLAVAIMFYFFV